MSPEYSVEEVRAMAAYCAANFDQAVLPGMLYQLANRIEADERAVPVAKIRHFNYHGIARNRFSQEAQMLDGVQELPEGTELFTHPPAQATQVEKCCAMAGTYACKCNTFQSTAATRPHSPDAADSGRMDVAKLLCDVRAIYIGATRPSGDGCDAETWDRIEAALAAQGQGEAKPFGYVSRDMTPFRSGTPQWQFTHHRVEPHGCIEAMPVYTAPPAPPAGVPDGDA